MGRAKVGAQNFVAKPLDRSRTQYTTSRRILGNLAFCVLKDFRPQNLKRLLICNQGQDT